MSDELNERLLRVRQFIESVLTEHEQKLLLYNEKKYDERVVTVDSVVDDAVELEIFSVRRSIIMKMMLYFYEYLRQQLLKEDSDEEEEEKGFSIADLNKEDEDSKEGVKKEEGGVGDQHSGKRGTKRNGEAEDKPSTSVPRNERKMLHRPKMVKTEGQLVFTFE
jgi:hypothetical protein